jgi:hypothetical protein
MDRLVAPDLDARTPTGRSTPRARPHLSARRRRRRTGVIGLGIFSATCWLVIVGALVLTVPAPGAAAPKGGAVLVPGWTARINQPGMPDWPIPVDRLAYDEYHRGFRESDDEAIDHAFAAFEWITVQDRQAVRIVEVDGEAVQVELLEGPNAGRRGWLKPRHLAP